LPRHGPGGSSRPSSATPDCGRLAVAAACGSAAGPWLWLAGTFSYVGHVIPETDVARARRWVGARNDSLPERARDQVRYELDVADRHLTVLEGRAPWRDGSRAEWTRFPIVRFHYVKARREWSTYWRDRNLKFHRYDPFPPTSALDDLLAAVDADRSGIFWG